MAFLNQGCCNGSALAGLFGSIAKICEGLTCVYCIPLRRKTVIGASKNCGSGHVSTRKGQLRIGLSIRTTDITFARCNPPIRRAVAFDDRRVADGELGGSDAVLCRPGLAWPKTRWQQIIVFGSIFLAVVGLVLFRQFEQDIDLATYNFMLGGLLILTVVFWRDPIPFAAIIATVLLAHHFVVEEVGGLRTYRQVLALDPEHAIEAERRAVLRESGVI